MANPFVYKVVTSKNGTKYFPECQLLEATLFLKQNSQDGVSLTCYFVSDFIVEVVTDLKKQHPKRNIHGKYSEDTVWISGFEDVQDESTNLSELEVSIILDKQDSILELSKTIFTDISVCFPGSYFSNVLFKN